MTAKTASDIRVMTKTCRLAADTLIEAGKHVKAGITTNDLDKIVHDYILSHGAIPSPLYYHGFPKSICTSVNGIICHGIPDDTILKEGDIINIDVTTYKNGFHGDTSATFLVGEVSEKAKKITEVALQAMMKGIEAVGPECRTGDIGFAIDKFVTRQGFFTVKQLGGHGIGREFHESPFIPSFGKKRKGIEIKPYTTFTVEPMINETRVSIGELDILNSSIKVYTTSDESLSAQFEHTILSTDSGYEILTI